TSLKSKSSGRTAIARSIAASTAPPIRAAGFWQSGLAGRLAGSAQAGISLSSLGGGVGAGAGVGVGTGVCCAGEEDPPQLARTTDESTRPSPAPTLLRTIKQPPSAGSRRPRVSLEWVACDGNDPPPRILAARLPAAKVCYAVCNLTLASPEAHCVGVP